MCLLWYTCTNGYNSNSTLLRWYELLSRQRNRSHDTERHYFNLSCCLADAQFFLPATTFKPQKTKTDKNLEKTVTSSKLIFSVYCPLLCKLRRLRRSPCLCVFFQLTNQLVAFHKTRINILLLEAILPYFIIYKSLMMFVADIQVCEVAVTLAPYNSVLASCPLTELNRICDLHLSKFNNLLNSNF